MSVARCGVSYTVSSPLPASEERVAERDINNPEEMLPTKVSERKPYDGSQKPEGHADLQDAPNHHIARYSRIPLPNNSGFVVYVLRPPSWKRTVCRALKKYCCFCCVRRSAELQIKDDSVHYFNRDDSKVKLSLAQGQWFYSCGKPCCSRKDLDELCGSCLQFNDSNVFNRDGHIVWNGERFADHDGTPCVELYYCGTAVSTLKKQSGDGFCGPNDGPQCQSCIRKTAQINAQATDVYD